MTSDGEGTSRLRAGGWLPEPAVHPVPGDASGPSSPPADEDVPPPAPVYPVAAEGGADAAIKPPGYLGHRREGGPAGRRWLLVAAGLVVVLCVVIVATVAMRSSPPSSRGAGAQEGAVVPGGVPASDDAPSSSAEARLDQSASPAPSRSSSARPPFQPIGLEAETGTELDGPAESVPYTGASGGRIVQNLGRLGPGAKKNGTLTFPNVTVPDDGAYKLTLYLVNNDTQGPATAVVTVAGGGSVRTTVAAGNDCCVRTVVTVNLKKGRNSVTFGNPDGHAPSVDRIVISAP